MKKRKDELLTIILFCGFLGAMALGYLLLPGQEFSEKEKRYLEKVPEFSVENLLSGQLTEDIEAYMADHIPGRNFFVGLNASFDWLSGRQVTKDVRLLEGGRLVESPVLWNETAAEKNMQVINAFAETAGRQVDLMVVPSGGWAAESRALTALDLFSRETYRDAELISDIYAMAEKNLHPVDVTPVLKDMEEYYYKTDHHWNSAGAHAVCGAYMESLGRDYPDADDFTVEQVDGFYGSTYTRGALWNVPGETLELWHGAEGLLVTNGESEETHEGVFYRERLQESDKYTVYLDGNHSLVRIENPSQKGAGKILVIRDSYSNAMGCFLAEVYETVLLVDLRYYKKPVSELLAQEEFSDVLVCYSIGNFMTDANIKWLK